MSDLKYSFHPIWKHWKVTDLREVVAAVNWEAPEIKDEKEWFNTTQNMFNVSLRFFNSIEVRSRDYARTTFRD